MLSAMGPDAGDLQAHRMLADALGSERPLNALLLALHRLLDVPVTVVGTRGGPPASPAARNGL
jgi:hypothetical protein